MFGLAPEWFALMGILSFIAGTIGGQGRHGWRQPHARCPCRDSRFCSLDDRRSFTARNCLLRRNGGEAGPSCFRHGLTHHRGVDLQKLDIPRDLKLSDGIRHVCVAVRLSAIPHLRRSGRPCGNSRDVADCRRTGRDVWPARRSAPVWLGAADVVDDDVLDWTLPTTTAPSA